MLKACNEQNMLKLVEALESGEYQQTKGCLRESRDNGEYAYCCLGVATDLRITEEKGDIWIHHGHSYYDDVVNPVSYLSSKTQDWLGIGEFNPQLFLGSDRSTAARLNDTGASFKEIAVAFRKTYLEEV